MTNGYHINIVQPGPRPPFYSVAEHLWGADCNIDLDGNSREKHDAQWTKLIIALRGTEGQRVDIVPVSSEPLVLQVNASSFELTEKTANFIVEHSGGESQHVA